MSQAWFEVVERMTRIQHAFESAGQTVLANDSVGVEAKVGWRRNVGAGVDKFVRDADKLWIVPEMMQLLRAASGDVVLQRVHRASLPWSMALVALPSEDPAAIFWGWERDRLTVGWLDGFHVATSPPLQEGERLTNDENGYGVSALLQALWILIQQRVLVTQPVEAIRQARRQWERTHSAPIPTVQEIVWRRTYERPEREGEPVAVDWSHRWMVSGHWRKQWLPTEATHRQTWVNPHIKGPSDKPLVLKEKVNVWKR